MPDLSEIRAAIADLLADFELMHERSTDPKLIEDRANQWCALVIQPAALRALRAFAEAEERRWMAEREWQACVAASVDKLNELLASLKAIPTEGGR